VNEVWLLTTLQQLGINGNLMMHSRNDVSTKIPKEISPFQQAFPT